MSKDLCVAAVIDTYAFHWSLAKIKLLMYLIDRKGIEISSMPVTDRYRWYKRTYKFTSKQRQANKDTGVLSFHDRWIIMNCMHDYWTFTASELKEFVYDLPEWRHSQRSYVSCADIALHTITSEKVTQFLINNELPGFGKLSHSQRKLAAANYLGEIAESQIKSYVAMNRLLRRNEK